MKMKGKRGFFAFFNTEAGRKVIFTAAGCTTIGLFAGNFIPQTILLDYYKQIFQCYKSGIEFPVPKTVLDRLEIALEQLKVHPYERKLIRPFSVYGFDLFSFGSTKYRFGCALGIPKNFSYETASDINHNEIVFRNQPVNWSSENGKLLESSLILSKDEQIFGLCKEILQIQTHRVLLNSLFPTVSFLTVYTIGNALNQKMNLYARPPSIRMVMYSILGLFGFGMWSFMKDFNQVQYDIDIDKSLCELGPDFIETGIRYYDKVLKRNIALRNLMGNDTYTAKGNENYLLRQKALPLTLRKSYFEMKMEELKKNLSENKENVA